MMFSPGHEPNFLNQKAYYSPLDFSLKGISRNVSCLIPFKSNPTKPLTYLGKKIIR
jgi:hypothetical protein